VLRRDPKGGSPKSHFFQYSRARAVARQAGRPGRPAWRRWSGQGSGAGTAVRRRIETKPLCARVVGSTRPCLPETRDPLAGPGRARARDRPCGRPTDRGQVMNKRFHTVMTGGRRFSACAGQPGPKLAGLARGSHTCRSIRQTEGASCPGPASRRSSAER
jgi:hypothetical protein